MKKTLLALTCLLLPMLMHAQQAYMEEAQDDRQRFINGLMHGHHALSPEDTGYLRFYDIKPQYRVKAFFVPITGKKPFLMKNMHGGISKAVRIYGYVYFNLMGASLKLYVYRFLDPKTNTDAGDALFIPFTDRTNYKTTFLGGRYLDLSIADVQNDRVILDFNKAYNPHTAYEMGYPYIIPPRGNRLKIDIDAGEKIFGHNPGY